MGAIFLHTLRESVSSRMGAALLAASALVPVIFLGQLRFVAQSGGGVIVYRGVYPEGTSTDFVRQAYGTLLFLTSGPWVFLVVFAAAPLLTSFLEKGWVELLLSKGLARWKILMARFGGALALYGATLLLFDLGPALYFWARLGVRPGRWVVALSFLVLSFTTFLATMSLVGVLHGHPALPIMVAFLQVPVSGVLADRAQLLYRVITAKWAHWLIDWAYRILPKNQELSRLALGYMQRGAIDSWWPVWSSALFMAGTLAFACWWFQQKSY